MFNILFTLKETFNSVVLMEYSLLVDIQLKPKSFILSPKFQVLFSNLENL
jgi:hypothetical protein